MPNKFYNQFPWRVGYKCACITCLWSTIRSYQYNHVGCIICVQNNVLTCHYQEWLANVDIRDVIYLNYITDGMIEYVQNKNVTLIATRKNWQAVININAVHIDFVWKSENVLQSQ